MSKAVEIEGYMLRVHTRYYDRVNGVVVCKKGENDKMFFPLKARPHGEWKPDGTCSECGVYSSLNKDTVCFCPNCGASMSKLQANYKQVKSKIVPDYRDGWRLKEGEAE